ncbi:tetratricopeptide repeat protein [Planctomicrobium sp. SH661]|uniref:tetratricopeptide repeat protein n=1 Tax=Planctomicrobium sp. SH661 TaxID=3448124 RepID=UPI003F5B777B
MKRVRENQASPVPFARLAEPWHAARFVLGLFISLICLGSQSSAADPQLLERYFDSLRSRGLFVIAEEYATARLADEQLSPADRTAIMIELARTLVDHGTLQSPGQRTELWDQSERVLKGSPGSSVTSEEQQQLAVWQVLLAAEKANILAFQAMLQPEAEQFRQQVIGQLQSAIRELNQLDQTLTVSKLVKEGLSSQQKQRLRPQAAKLRGESLIWLAQLQPPGVDRTPFCREADRALEGADDARRPVAWNRSVAVLQGRSARLQGDLKRAERALEKGAGLSAATLQELDSILAERILMELGQGRTDVALQMVVDRIRQPAPPTDELRAVAVQTLLQAAKVANDKGDTATRDQILTEARLQNEKTFGIWRLMTASLIERQQQEQELGGELAQVIREALAAWEAKNVDLAIEKYGTAATLAYQRQLPEKAVEFAFTRASMLLQARRWKQAEAALAEITQSFPDHPRTAEADLLRCYAIGQRDPHGTDFQNALQEHLARFPQSPTRGDALWMKGVEAEHRQQLPEAIQAYRQIPADNSHRTEADLRILVLIERLQNLPAELRGDHPPGIDTLAAEEIRRIVVPLLAPGKLEQPADCQMLLQAVRVCLQIRPPLLAESEQMIKTVLQRIDQEKRASLQSRIPCSPEWETVQRTARQLQILALASQGKLADAQRVLQELGRSDPASLLSILATLTDLTSRIDSGPQKELGALQRMTVEEISVQRNEMTDEQRGLLDRASVQASLALEDWPQAIGTLEDLLQKSPQDVPLMRQLIDVSMKQGRAPDWTRAKELWMRIEAVEKKGSPSWIEARISIAELLERTGDAAGAKKLLGVTRTLYPQMGTPELKDRSEQLWTKLK